ncbi:MAG: hypothetical protein IJ906_02930, partial [Oscillospiraceae bacterium]|nr:hypothetical protein [Oscillospiraceae bacterium]
MDLVFIPLGAYARQIGKEDFEKLSVKVIRYSRDVKVRKPMNAAYRTGRLSKKISLNKKTAG